MAHTKSAIKRLRTSQERNLRNRMRNSELKTAEKKFQAAVAAGNTVEAVEFGKKFASSLDKAAKAGTIHANRAGNKKSQVDKLLNGMAK